jgi:hypothetical protein
MATYKLELPLSLNYKTMVGTESQRKLLYNVRPCNVGTLLDNEIKLTVSKDFTKFWK